MMNSIHIHSHSILFVMIVQYFNNVENKTEALKTKFILINMRLSNKIDAQFVKQN